MKMPRSDGSPRELDFGLEARHLAPVGVAVGLQVDPPEVGTVEEDHACTRAEDRPVECADRLVQSVQPREPHDCRRLAPWDDEAVEPLELLRQAHLDDVGAEPAQHVFVLPEGALQREHPDPWTFAHQEECRSRSLLPRSGGGRSARWCAWCGTRLPARRALRHLRRSRPCGLNPEGSTSRGLRAARSRRATRWRCPPSARPGRSRPR